MSYFQSNQMAALYPVPNPINAVGAIPVTAEFIVPAGLAANDIIEFGAIPEGCVPISMHAAFEKGDTGTTLTYTAGLFSGNYGTADGTRTVGSEFFTASTAAQAGGIQNLANVAGLLLPTQLYPQGWGLKVAGGATTLVVGAKIRATLMVRPAPVGMA